MQPLQLNAETEIDAPAQRVWEVLVDFDRYPEWNPLITRIVGDLRQGERLVATVSLPGQKDRHFKPTVTRVVPASELAWQGQFIAKKLLTAEHCFRLIRIGRDRTRVAHSVRFSGLLVKSMGATLAATARAFAHMNQALKRHLETPRGTHRPSP